MKPTKEQIEKVAFELFNADFGGQITPIDWNWRPERIKSRYKHLAISALLKWEKIRGKR